VFVDSGIQHEMSMRHTAICGPSDSAMYFHIILLILMIFEKVVIEHQVCVLIFFKTTNFSTWSR